MEYGMIEGRSIEQLVAVLNVQVAEGWELAGTPVSEAGEHGGGRRWYAVIRKDDELSSLRRQAQAALTAAAEMTEQLQRDRAAAAELLGQLRQSLADPSKH